MRFLCVALLSLFAVASTLECYQGRIPAFDWDGKSTKDNEGYEHDGCASKCPDFKGKTVEA
ncbi:hypothetical protein PRIPAC_93079 [Pristionchus pacificus]|uniref:Uncharacterized protein n=1 Tax=Pristionchus pacificus TaxID=54126 RepID=A0A2A6CE67_PRIPA|nr:hypothetical protein PRIPAC_93079 [Pristionchus pacificus]|eukprot:PDM76378.1 hypothetical protein PRIPAC_39982 [Pristionchus pacificus]